MNRGASDESASRIADGLMRLAQVLRSEAWAGAGERNLTPTQGELLKALVERGPQRLKNLAAGLAITPATTSKAITTLVDKGLVEKTTAAEDRRALSIAATRAGKREAAQARGWPAVLTRAAASLPRAERAGLLRGIVALMLELQRQGVMNHARTCASCRHFRPHRHAKGPPHHCAFVDAAFGDADLRVDCVDHDHAPASQRRNNRRRFLHVVD